MFDVQKYIIFTYFANEVYLSNKVFLINFFDFLLHKIYIDIMKNKQLIFIRILVISKHERDICLYI